MKTRRCSLSACALALLVLTAIGCMGSGGSDAGETLCRNYRTCCAAVMGDARAREIEDVTSYCSPDRLEEDDWEQCTIDLGAIRRELEEAQITLPDC
jgi:hypothetical protein